MSEVSIDTLELQLVSNLGSSADDLNKLVEALGNVKNSLGLTKGDFAGANLAVTTLRNNLSLFFKDFGGGERTLKLRIDTNAALTSVEKLQLQINNALKNAKIDNKGIAADLASAFNIKDSKAIKQIETQLNEYVSHFAKTYNDGFGELDEGIFERLSETIVRNARITQREIGNTIDSTKVASYELQQFYNDFKNTKLNISDALKSGIGTAEYRNLSREFSRNLSRSGKGINLNKNFSEIYDNGNYKMVLDAAARRLAGGGGELDLSNEVNQVNAFFEALRMGRESVKPIKSSDLVDADLQSLRDAVGETLADSVSKSITGFTSNASRELASEGLPINIKVDETKIQQDIRLAINNALREPISVKINIDTAALIDSVNTAFAGMDTGRFKEFSTLVSEMQTALSGFTASDGARSFGRVVNSIGRLGGENVEKAVAVMPYLRDEIAKLIDTINKLNINTSNVDLIGQLATAFNRLGSAAPNMERVTESLQNFRGNLNLNQFFGGGNGGGGNGGGGIPRILNVFNSLPQGLKSACNGIRNVGTESKRAITQVLQLSKSFDVAKVSANSMMYAYMRLRAVIWGIRRAFQLVKSSMDYASSLTEVSNVVRNVFQGAAGERNLEASFVNSNERFGMNELTVKQIASRYQAMGQALGVTGQQASDVYGRLQTLFNTIESVPKEERYFQGVGDSMADLSIELTKLAGDIASFYNVGVTDAAQDLESIFTGMVKPLRQYGIDLTQANLQQWALKNGIEADMSTMTQAEKVMLRYQYTMSQLSIVQGDFAETSTTWANQTKILSQNVQELGGVWGGVLVNAFKPFIVGLNRILKSVIDFSKKIADALGQIFGWTIEITSGGQLDPLSDMEGGVDTANDLAEGIGGAADKAEELEEALSVLDFDELNQLVAQPEPNEESGSGGSGGGGDGGTSAVADGLQTTLKRVPTIFENITSEIKTLFDLGRYISEALEDSLRSIPWAKIYATAGNFGTGLAEFLNGLITPNLFDAVGESIAKLLNAEMLALNNFETTFDFPNLGKSIAAGINGFFDTFSFRLAGTAKDKFVQGVLDALLAALEDVNFKKIGEAIADYLSQLEIEDWIIKFGKIAGEFAKGIVDTISTAVEKLGGPFEIGQKIQNMLNLAMEQIEWDEIYHVADSFGTGLAEFLNGLISPDLFSNITATLAGGLNTITHVLNSFATTFDFKNLGDSIAAGINTFFKTYDFVLAADTANKWIKGILDALITAVDNTDWYLIGQKIGEFIDNLDVELILEKVVDLGIKIAIGIVKLIAGAFDKAPVQTAIITAFAGIKLTGFLTGMSTALGKGFSGPTFLSLLTTAISNPIGAALLAAVNIALYEHFAPKVADMIKRFVPTLEGLTTGEVMSPEHEMEIRDAAFENANEMLNQKNASASRGKKESPDLPSTTPGSYKGTKTMSSGNSNSGFADLGKNMASNLANGFSDGVRKDVIPAFTEGYNQLNGVTSRLLNAVNSTTKTGVDNIDKTVSSGGKTINNRMDADLEEAKRTAEGGIKNIHTTTNTEVDGIITDVTAKQDKASTDVNSKFTDLFGKITGAVNDNSGPLKDLVARMVDDSVVGQFDIADRLAEKSNAGFTAFNSAFINNAPTLFENLSAINGNMINTFANIADDFTNIGSAATSGLNEGVTSNLPSLTETLTTIHSKIIDAVPVGDMFHLGAVAFSETNSGAQSEFGGIDWVKDTVRSKIMSAVPIEDMFNRGATAFSEANSGAQSEFGGLDWVASTIRSKIINAVPGDMFHRGAVAFSEVNSGAQSEFAGLDWVASTVRDKLQSGVSVDLYGTGRWAIQRYSDGIQSVHVAVPHIVQDSFNSILNGANQVIAHIPNMSVSWYAKGAMFKGPNVIGVGEAGREAVLPLTNQAVMNDIADSIMEGYGGKIDYNGLRSAVAAGVTEAMMRSPERPITVISELTLDEMTLGRAVNRAQANLDYRTNATARYNQI